MKKCWRCGNVDQDVEAFAQVEEPKRPYLDLHFACADAMGVAGELVPVVIEESFGDL